MQRHSLFAFHMFEVVPLRHSAKGVNIISSRQFNACKFCFLLFVNVVRALTGAGRKILQSKTAALIFEKGKLDFLIGSCQKFKFFYLLRTLDSDEWLINMHGWFLIIVVDNLNFFPYKFVENIITRRIRCTPKLLCKKSGSNFTFFLFAAWKEKDNV